MEEIIQGDCVEVMKEMPENSVDLILTDPPYGVTQNQGDIVVDLSELFRVGRGVVMTAQQPYTTEVISQFRDSFRYDLVWDKVLTSGFLNANRMPLRSHESILIFGDVKYNPQKVLGQKNHSKGQPKVNKNSNYGKFGFVDNADTLGHMKHPKSIVRFSKPHPSVAVHRTEKPVELMAWLIRTYSNEGDTVLDPFMGSGTTGVVCKRLKRNFIGIEIDEKYYKIAEARIKSAQNPLI